MDLITKSALLAYAAHDGVKRKYSDAPYFVHPERMAQRAKAMGLPCHVVAAIYCHDIEEDCSDKFKAELRVSMPEDVVALVLEVTNPSKAFPDMSRRERKEMDREHLKHVSYHAKVIKFIDRIDNIRDMVDADRGFLRKYSEETMLLVEALLEGEADRLLDELAEELRMAVVSTQWAAMKKTLHP